MRTALELPDELMREVKMRAAVEGRKLKDVVADALRTGPLVAGPAHHSPQVARVEADPQTGLPVVIGVTDAPGSAMTRDQLTRMELDTQYREDLRRAGFSL